MENNRAIIAQTFQSPRTYSLKRRQDSLSLPWLLLGSVIITLLAFVEPTYLYPTFAVG